MTRQVHTLVNVELNSHLGTFASLPPHTALMSSCLVCGLPVLCSSLDLLAGPVVASHVLLTAEEEVLVGPTSVFDTQISLQNNNLVLPCEGYGV